MTKLTAEQLQTFLRDNFSMMEHPDFLVEEVADRRATVRMRCGDRHLRPGGTISGPALMTLADTAIYVALLATIGMIPLAVTTNLNINFLRKPPGGDVIARAVLLKVGNRLAVGEVTMYSDGDDEPVAHATVTYSIPPASGTNNV